MLRCHFRVIVCFVVLSRKLICTILMLWRSNIYLYHLNRLCNHLQIRFLSFQVPFLIMVIWLFTVLGKPRILCGRWFCSIIIIVNNHLFVENNLILFFPFCQFQQGKQTKEQKVPTRNKTIETQLQMIYTKIVHRRDSQIEKRFHPKTKVPLICKSTPLHHSRLNSGWLNGEEISKW